MRLQSLLGDTDSIDFVKYDICSEHGIFFFDHKQLRTLDLFPIRNEMIPDPDSIPLSILNHPLGKRHEINFSAYDPPKLTLSPVEGAHPVLVLNLDYSSVF